MQKFFFWSWILLSLSISILFCSTNLPIRDDYFPAIQDNISSVIFLTGESIILSSITCIIIICINIKRIKVALISFITIISVLLFAYIFRSMFSLYLLIVEAFIIMMTVGLIHFFLTYYFGKITVLKSPVKIE